MKRNYRLTSGEVVRWEGRPAPRCYTFRHWRHSLFGCFFLALAGFWQYQGVEMASAYALPWLAWLPLPFVLLGVYFSAGHLVQARLEWNHVLYLITDRRLMVQRGLSASTITAMDLSAITYFSLHRHGDQLATLRVHQGQARRLVLHCLEHPQLAAALLEEAIKGKGGGQDRAGQEANQVGPPLPGDG
jgi:hypothetical protein